MRCLLMALALPALLAGLVPAWGGSADGVYGADLGTPRRLLGAGWLVTNDVLGDNQDRWRTGGLSVSQAFGPTWRGEAPYEFGALLELRLQAQVIQPDVLSQFNPYDRRYAGVVAIGLHNHVQRGGHELALGGDLVMVGPQTDLDDVQAALHDVFGGASPAAAVRAAQIGNRLRPTAVVEYGRSFSLSPALTLRPFAEARAGDETMARVGVDLVLGKLWQNGLLARDSVTGYRYPVVNRANSGLAMVLGMDTAYVTDSVYLPRDAGAAQLESNRNRLRAGLHAQRGRLAFFYGASWLGREFTGQPEDQLVGAIQVQLRF